MNVLKQTCWVLIPIKAPGSGKTRLAGVLDDGERRRLVTGMLRHVVDVAQTCDSVTRVCLVGPADYGLVPMVDVLGDTVGELNAAVQSAMRELRLRTDDGIERSAGGCPHHRVLPSRFVIVAGDLPQIKGSDFTKLAHVPRHSIGIAPDRHGTGTNALSLPADEGKFQFSFGKGSYALHSNEAHRLCYRVETLLSDGLRKDIDEAADLEDAYEYKAVEKHA